MTDIIVNLLARGFSGQRDVINTMETTLISHNGMVWGLTDTKSLVLMVYPLMNMASGLSTL